MGTKELKNWQHGYLVFLKGHLYAIFKQNLPSGFEFTNIKLTNHTSLMIASNQILEIYIKNVTLPHLF